MLKITITNQEDVNKAVVKIYTGDSVEEEKDIIEPKQSREYHLYGQHYVRVSQS